MIVTTTLIIMTINEDGDHKFSNSIYYTNISRIANFVSPFITAQSLLAEVQY